MRDGGRILGFIAATAVIGFVTEAKRKIVSRRIGAEWSNARVPMASTCSAPRPLMSATRPGSRRNTQLLRDWSKRAVAAPERGKRSRTSFSLAASCAWSLARMNAPRSERVRRRQRSLGGWSRARDSPRPSRRHPTPTPPARPGAEP